MTTAEYGGGPTVEQRRSFAALKEGSHIPGYQGYCPQLKYSIGKTFGEQTGELASIRRCLRHQTMTEAEVECTLKQSRSFNGLPVSTGDNKYTENMVPGYSGYIPRWPFKFGKTYKEECDVCLAEFFCDCQQTAQLENDQKLMSRSLPSLRPVSGDPEVRDKLNSFRDTALCKETLAQHKRSPQEAPMPGYRGFVPRIGVTELGLGGRYHETTRNGLEAFYKAHQDRAERLNLHLDPYGAQRVEPVTINRNPTTQRSSGVGNRIYIQEGMIPKYTGYLPQQRYVTGNTFGDETRSLEVCAHDQPSYGEYVRQCEKQELRAN